MGGDSTLNKIDASVTLRVQLLPCVWVVRMASLSRVPSIYTTVKDAMTVTLK